MCVLLLEISACAYYQAEERGGVTDIETENRPGNLNFSVSVLTKVVYFNLALLLMGNDRIHIFEFCPVGRYIEK